MYEGISEEVRGEKQKLIFEKSIDRTLETKIRKFTLRVKVLK